MTHSRLIEPVPNPPAVVRVWLLPAVVVLLGVAFVFLPGSISDKASAALHGLCAQTPSHSFSIGGLRLPFDARMTGIYGGAMTTGLCLIAGRRLRAAALPPARVLAVFGLSVAALGLDGANSLAWDLGLVTPYAPDNRLRLATGILVGIALATMLFYLAATTLWRRPEPETAAVGGLFDWLRIAAWQLPFPALIASGVPFVAVPVVAYLLAAALAVFATLLLVAVLVSTGRDRRYRTAADASPAAAAACLGAVGLIAALAIGRYALEAAFGIPAAS